MHSTFALLCAIIASSLIKSTTAGVLASPVAITAPGVVTSRSSQYFVRNYNTLAAAYIAAAPLVAETPIVPATPLVAKTLPASLVAAPLLSPYKSIPVAAKAPAREDVNQVESSGKEEDQVEDLSARLKDENQVEVKEANVREVGKVQNGVRSNAAVTPARLISAAPVAAIASPYLASSAFATSNFYNNAIIL